jgi:maltose/moltooligosaccharide transporter
MVCDHHERFSVYAKIMKQLAWVQFFSWFALFSMWFTPSQPLHIYGTTDTTSEAYNTGANQVGEMFANYNLIAAILLFFYYWQNIRVENSHFVALACGGLGLMSVYFIEPTVFTMEWLPMVGVGIA